MDEECYPAISMSTATGGHPHRRRYVNGVNTGNSVGFLNDSHTNFAVNGPKMNFTNAAESRLQQPCSNNSVSSSNININLNSHHHQHQQLQQQQQQHPAGFGNSPAHHQYQHLMSHDDDSDSSSYDSDEDMDLDVSIKEEPLSPGSSCPPSPVENNNNNSSSKNSSSSNNNNSRSKNKNLSGFNTNSSLATANASDSSAGFASKVSVGKRMPLSQTFMERCYNTLRFGAAHLDEFYSNPTPPLPLSFHHRVNGHPRQIRAIKC